MIIENKKLEISFLNLEAKFNGELFYNNSSLHEAHKLIYATDASVYQEKPLAVAIPKTNEDLSLLIKFANTNLLSLIPRAAGTSLAGQVVGNGIVVDISKYFNEILEINVEEQYVRVQPGVIRDDLNVALHPFGLMFGPETSTANRAMIGGMIGNNSCGLHSIVWGDTRDHLIEAKVLLSNGDEAVFKSINEVQLAEKIELNSLEGAIYRGLHYLISDAANVDAIKNGYPKKTLKRRNTGYALDFLIAEDYSKEGDSVINLCQILAGSEGTLAFIKEAKLNLLLLPPKNEALLCVHFHKLSEALLANLVILKYEPMASELVDKYILDFTKGHSTYQNNRFFIEGEPEAILMVEFFEESEELLNNKTQALIADLKLQGLGYAFPVITGKQTKLVWDVRKAGLGLIRNLPGDHQPVNLIEDCAVSPEDLPAYISELQLLLKKHNLTASYYAHAGAGELHVEPMINLKTIEGRELFRVVLQETAALVKKYRGSLSGEHGDGRLRGEFIPNVLGDKVYQMLKDVKQLFDPLGVFNANKIVNTPKMDESLRYTADQEIKPLKTVFNFDKQEGILKLAEKCSGSGDCRKTHISGGTMCPSYMATHQEKDTTRARANILRQFLTDSSKINPFDHQEIKEVMDLCLSCKACKSECPSSVDVAKMKAEFLQHYYDANGVPFRTRIIGSFTKSQRLASVFPVLYNLIIKNKFTGKLIKELIGFAPERSLPAVGHTTLRKWKKQRDRKKSILISKKRVYLFCDEFTNYNDVEIGKTTVKLLNSLGYEVIIPEHVESGRTYLSKGLVKEAQKIVNKNVKMLSKIISVDAPLIGIEPSAILTFRDEYVDLVNKELQVEANNLAKNSFMIEEFLIQELENKNISPQQFTTRFQKIKLHGHCYQKAFNLVSFTQRALSIPENYEVELIQSGCCGMAGSFGYEKEHYDVSLKIGELVLLPEVRKQALSTIIAASGTSCRHQIKDGTERVAMHPVEILWDALSFKVE